MSTKKPIILINGAPTQYTPPTTSAGAGNAGDIPGLDSTGRLDASFMPVGVAPDVIPATATDTLTAGMFVNVWNNGGVLSVRKAVGTDATKPANGFVLAGASISSTVSVYPEGLNTLVPLGSFAAGDRGAPVWLDASTGGSCTKTAPSGAGNLQQYLGDVMDVGATVTVQFTRNQGYVM